MIIKLEIILAIAKKEIRQLKRETRMLFVIFIFPMFLLLIFGYAINLDVKHIKLGVLDFDETKETRSMVRSLISSEYFDLVGYLSNYNEAEEWLNSNKAQLIIVFNKDFTRNLYKFQNSKIQFLIDGVNANTSSIIFNYSNIASHFFLVKWLKENQNIFLTKSNFSIVQLEPRFWYNPNLKSNVFLVPGLIGIIIILTSAITVSLSVVKEKERNTIEQILISPIEPMDFIVGKILPYSVIALINSFLVVILGHIVFNVPIRGNLFLLLLSVVLYIYSSLSIGVFVSVIATNQLLAFLLVVIISVLPSMILSGFIFPIESMPLIIQIITNFTPAKFFLSIIRSVLLKGVPFDTLLTNYIYLLAYGTVFFGFSFVAYRKSFRLDL
jgi:ABC-2 type transport system permease protein